jgi:hypothetical protein
LGTWNSFLAEQPLASGVVLKKTTSARIDMIRLKEPSRREGEKFESREHAGISWHQHLLLRGDRIVKWDFV